MGNKKQGTTVQWLAKNRPILRRKINEYKLEIGCADCGYKKHAVALDFDHLRDKSRAVSRMVSSGGYSWERILEEIAKCEVVCSNCHRVRGEARRIVGT